MGPYELIGRLGEGGMGTVYLALSPEGRRVAVKIIRSGLAHDPQFRQRFRSEVERAQDVPPFCTAEVLDADPDHAQPYLVVEYVEGPSLASVVADHGPLTPSNLHGLAIGVATALTAIHGAGVIHRDLKPSNVLLAPGSPKVIDFGIARAVEGAVSHTRTDQMVGTVTYMAPERFDSGNGRTVTPAADIFAWGAVVAYAGTGRTPFAADLPHMVAVRILTMPPDLDGLTGPLRELVDRALAKDPAERPTARELLDRLLATGPHRSGGAAAVLARQPALREAVAEARAADDVHARERTATALPAPAQGEPAGGSGASATTRFNLQGRAAPAEAGPPAEIDPQASTPAVPPARHGWGRTATVIFAFTALIAVSLLAGIVYGVIPLDRRPDPDPSGGGQQAGAVVPSVSPGTPSGRPADALIISDPLTAERDWRVVRDPRNKATCEFDGALVVQKGSPGPYRCPGPRRLHTDFIVAVTAKLHTKGSCAALWFRFDKVSAESEREAGYVLVICADGYTLMTHGAAEANAMAELTTFPFDDPSPLRQPIAVGITAEGSNLSFSRDGEQIGTWRDSRFARGRVVLGILNRSADQPTTRVSFTDVEIRA
jgi:hypothetical protein